MLILTYCFRRSRCRRLRRCLSSLLFWKPASHPTTPRTYLRVWMSGSPTCLMNPLLQIIPGNKTLVQLTAMYLTPRFLLNANLPSGSSSSSSGSEGISTCNFFFQNKTNLTSVCLLTNSFKVNGELSKEPAEKGRGRN